MFFAFIAILKFNDYTLLFSYNPQFTKKDVHNYINTEWRKKVNNNIPQQYQNPPVINYCLLAHAQEVSLLSSSSSHVLFVQGCFRSRLDTQ